MFNILILLEKAVLEGPVPLCECDTWIAQQTHEAAREGTVPLCEDDLWKPEDTPQSSHSGLMRQPTKEGPVSGILATVKLECKSFETMGAAGCLKSIPVFLRIGFAWSMNPL